MKFFVKVFLLLLLVLGLSSCGHGYRMHQAGSHGYAEVHERPYNSAASVRIRPAYPQFYGAEDGDYFVDERQN